LTKFQDKPLGFIFKSPTVQAWTDRLSRHVDDQLLISIGWHLRRARAQNNCCCSENPTKHVNTPCRQNSRLF